MSRKMLSIITVLALLITAMPFAGMVASAADTDVVINQVYGNGGKTEAPSDYCFIELYNKGDEDVSLVGWSVVYTSTKAGVADQAFELEGSIPANTSYLIRGAACSTTTDYRVVTIGDNFDLDCTDLVINNKSFNVALFNGETKVDSVTAIDAEGTEEVAGEGNPVTNLSKQKSVRRVDFADTDDNASDFEIIKYERASLAGFYDEAEFVAAFAPKSTSDGVWTETVRPEENFVGYDFLNEEGYWGPYGNAEVTEDGLVFDVEPENAYFSVDSTVAETANPEPNYAIITAYTDDVDGTDGFTMTFGGVGGKPWTQYVGIDGNTLPKLTTEPTEYVIDLEASEIKSVFDTGVGVADLAMNKSLATEGNIIVEKVQFSLAAPKAAPDVEPDPDPQPEPAEDIVGFDFVNKTGYAGIYPDDGSGPFELTDEGLEIDASKAAGWLTADLEEGEVDGMYKYAVVTMKTDDPFGTKNFSLGIGGRGVTLFDWYLATTGKKNTNYIGTEFAKYVFDLEASGITQIDAPVGTFDMSYNQSSAKSGTITIASIEFTDEIPELTLADEPWVGFDFINEVGYYGPYGDAGEVTENGYEFDTSVNKGYMTAEVDPQGIGTYKYAYVTLKSSAPETTANFAMTIGGVGQAWHEWTLADGTNPDAELPEDLETFCIDLEASGVDAIVVGGIDFAINQGDATEGIITVESVRFANAGPDEEEPPVEPTVVPAPTNVAAVANGADSITVSWDAVEGANEYGVYRSTEEDGTYTFVGYTGNLEYVDAELDAETTYFYKVVASDGENESEESEAASATTEAAPVLAPADLYLSSVTPSTATNYDGDNVVFNAIVRNTGEATVDTYFVSFYVDSNLVETVQVTTPLAGGAMAPVVSTEAWPAYFGSHSVKAIVTEDIQGIDITEEDLTNNAFRSRFTVIDDVNPNA
jgi:hypothetical protein